MRRQSLAVSQHLLTMLALGGGLLALPAVRAEVLPEAGLEASLAQPGCRAALGVSASEPAAQLLRAQPSLAAKVTATPACRAPQSALGQLERLEQELQASRQRMAAQQAQLAGEAARQEALARDLAQIRSQLTGQPPTTDTAATLASPGTVASVPGGSASENATGPAAAAKAEKPAPAAVQYTPGKGFALQAGESSFRLWAEAKLLGFSSTRYTFNPGQPLIVSPKDPDPSYDLSAQQSMVYAAFQGPQWKGWTPGAFAIFSLQDNILAEGYQFTPVVYYGEMSKGSWRILAGQAFDVFAPRDPDTLPSGKLAATGNAGAYRPQFRLENNFTAGSGFGGILQLAASSPITTALPDNVDLTNLQRQDIVEDNGWPNLEGRLSMGFGAAAQRAGGRRQRPVELGVSGVIGQLRVLDNIRPTDPITLVSDRSVVNVWGAAFDGHIALGSHVGLSGELFTGQGLGEYMAGIFQTYNRSSNQAVPTSGGWGQLYVYLADNLRLNFGYGIDNAEKSGRFGILSNAAAFANVVWDANPWLQLGLEGNYKLTTYDTFGDKNAWVVISQVMFRL